MSVIDRAFLTELVFLPDLAGYDELVSFMHDDVKVQGMFPSGILLVNAVTEANSGSAVHHIMYLYQAKYILFHVFEGSCDGCHSHCPIIKALTRSTEQAYVTTDFPAMSKYIHQRMVDTQEDEILYYFDTWSAMWTDSVVADGLDMNTYIESNDCIGMNAYIKSDACVSFDTYCNDLYAQQQTLKK